MLAKRAYVTRRCRRRALRSSRHIRQLVAEKCRQQRKGRAAAPRRLCLPVATRHVRRRAAPGVRASAVNTPPLPLSRLPTPRRVTGSALSGRYAPLLSSVAVYAGGWRRYAAAPATSPPRHTVLLALPGRYEGVRGRWRDGKSAAHVRAAVVTHCYHHIIYATPIRLLRGGGGRGYTDSFSAARAPWGTMGQIDIHIVTLL